MIKTIAIFLALASFGSASGQTKLASQYFESIGWESEFTSQSDWADNITRTTNDPATGTYSLRWNQDNTRIDPITGLLGIGNSLLDWRGGVDLPALTTDELYFTMQFRHDDYTNESTTDSSTRKLFYIIDDVYGVGAMYLKYQLGNVGLNISYANGAYSDQWARDNWGYSGMALRAAGVEPALDGTWHKVEMYWNYASHYMMVWMDGILLLPQDLDYIANYPIDAAAGRILWDPLLALDAKGMQIMYFDQSRDLVNGADGTGYYAGIQIDDLEYWDGLPTGGSVLPPVAAFSGLPLSGQAPFSVVFTDESTNTPTGWSWDFGDGGTSTSQSPTYIYASAGTYTVTLTASSANGSDGETRVDYVTVSGVIGGPMNGVTNFQAN